MAKDFVIKIGGEADFSDIAREAAELRSILEKTKGSVAGFREELENQAKGELEYKLVVRSEFNNQGIKEAKLEVVSVNKEYEGLLSTIRKIEKEPQKGSVTNLRQAINEAKQARDSVQKYSTSFDGIDGKVRKISGEWEAQNTKVRNLSRELDIVSASNIWQKLSAEYNLKGLFSAGKEIANLVNIFQAVGIAIGQVLSGVNTLFQALQKLQAIELTFKGIGASGDVTKVFQDSSKIALGLGVNINTVRDAFQQLSPIVLATGGSMDNVSAITESLSSRFVVFGLSADKSRRVMNGVIQAFGKGKLMAEELTQQISEADPAFRVDLARAIGITVKELGDWVKEGKVTNQVLIEAIPKMSKAGFLLGKLGESATSAATAFRDGNVTIEQVRTQIANLDQLNLEKLAGIFKPFLASILEVNGVLTDLSTQLINSEAFQLFSSTLNSLASQISLVAQGIAKAISVIGSLADQILAPINAFDDLTEKFLGVRLGAEALAAIITLKLVVALGRLAVAGAVGAAIQGMKLLTAAITALSSGSLLSLARNVGLAILSFIGLGKATDDQIKKDVIATGATKAREAASKALTRALGVQAAAQAAVCKVTCGAGGTGAGGKLPKPTPTGSPVMGPAPPPPTQQIKAAGDAAKGAQGGVNGLSQAWKNLGTAIARVPKSPTAIIATTAALIVGGIAWTSYNGLTREGAQQTKTFAKGIKEIDTNAKNATDAIDRASKGTGDFESRLSNVKLRKDDFISNNFGPDLWRKVRFDGLIKSAKQGLDQVNTAVGGAAAKVENYSASYDKTGIVAERIGVQIGAAEKKNQLLLDITKKKREDLLKEIQAGGKGATKENLRQVKEYNKVTLALEENRKKINEVKAAAEAKGIPVKFSAIDAEAVLKGLQDKLTALQQKAAIEIDPAKLKAAQGEANALTRLLAYLKADRIEIKIDLQYKEQVAALQNALTLLQSRIANLKSAQDLEASISDYAKARVGYSQQTAEKELQSLRDRGASQADILAKEKEILAYKQQAEQIEKAAILQKIESLPAIQAAERSTLEVQQKLKTLELEKLRIAQERAILEQKSAQSKLEGERATLAAKGDTAGVAVVDRQLALQKEIITNLQKEKDITESQISTQQQANALDSQALANQQAAARNALAAQAASMGITKNIELAGTNANYLGQNLNVVDGKLVSLENRVVGVVNGVKVYAQTWAPVKEGINGAIDRVKELQGLKPASGIAISADPKLKPAIDDISTTLGIVKTQAEEFGNKLKDGSVSAVSTAGSLEGASQSLGTGASSAGTLSNSLSTGAGEAERINSAISGLDGKTITVNVKYNAPKGLWTGGPTVAGQTYRINEIGKEGFLSNSGKLSPINRPKNSLWTAPSKGFVIPAHIMRSIDAPESSVRVPGSRTNRISGSIKSTSGSAGLVGELRRIANGSNSSELKNEIATTHAAQTMEIGRLTRAVRDLVEKDWNVNVKVRNNGNATYMNALNRFG